MSSDPLDVARNHLASGQLAAAHGYLSAYMQHNPNDCEAIHLTAIVYHGLGDVQAASDWFERAIAAMPDRADFWANYVQAMLHSKADRQLTVAVAERAVSRLPGLKKIWQIIIEDAEQSRDVTRLAALLERACQAMPNEIDWKLKLARCYRQLFDGPRAIATLIQGQSVAPSNIEVLNLMGDILFDSGHIARACRCWERVLQLHPEEEHALAQLVVGRRHICGWHDFDEWIARLQAVTRRRLAAGLSPLEGPVTAMGECMDYEYQLLVNQGWVNTFWPQWKRSGAKNSPIASSLHGTLSRPISVGYVSDELRVHPTGMLMQDYFEFRDRERFRTVLYFDHEIDEQDALFQKFASECELGVRVFGKDSDAFAEQIRKDHIDILVDLKGWHGHNRLDLFAKKPAPIAVGYLAYPGTTGAAFIDYLLVDEIVAPESASPFFSEKLAYLGRCYQVNPIHRVDYATLRQLAGTRQQHGLPPHAIVLAVTGQTYKLDPYTMDVWLDILSRTPDTVLWMLSLNFECRPVLQQMVVQRGLSPERLVFADFTEHTLNLARLTHADIVMDTRICNGHTTTSEALWCQVPVVAMLGKHFASRVAASILSEVGLPELITNDLDGYRSKILELIGNPDLRRALKKRLQPEHLRQNLFNTPDFVKRVENLFEQMHAMNLRGEPPRNLYYRG